MDTGCSRAGSGLHYGAERIGATVLPTSVGNTERQIKLTAGFRYPRRLRVHPRYLLHIGEVGEKMGIDIKNDTDLRTGDSGGQPGLEGMRTRIQDWLGIVRCKSTIPRGISELSGPRAFTECSQQNGVHIWSDLARSENYRPQQWGTA